MQTLPVSGFTVYDIHKSRSGDNLFVREFLVKKNAFLDYIILEKMKQGLGRIITSCSKFCFSAHLYPSFYRLLFFIIINLSIFPSFSFYFNFFFFFISLFHENVTCCSKFPHCNATDRRLRARLYTINWITQRFIVDRHG